MIPYFALVSYTKTTVRKARRERGWGGRHRRDAGATWLAREGGAGGIGKNIAGGRFKLCSIQIYKRFMAN